MQFRSIGIAGTLACCVFASGCSKSNQVAPDFINTLAEQAAKNATLEIELREARKSLAQATDQAEQLKAKLASSQESEHRLQESTRLIEEARQKAVEETSLAKKQLKATSDELDSAVARLRAMDDADQHKRNRLAAVGVWLWEVNDNPRPTMEFRDDGTGLLNGLRNKEVGGRIVDQIDYRFEYRETNEPGVFTMRTVLKKSGAPVVGTFRITDGTPLKASLEGWIFDNGPLRYVKTDFSDKE